jgi:hypothetical protein
LAITHERFWTLENQPWVNRAGADQHRSIVAISVPLSRQLRVEPSYLRQQLEPSTRDRVNDVVQLSLRASL